jgi:hypothetical protein
MNETVPERKRCDFYLVFGQVFPQINAKMFSHSLVGCSLPIVIFQNDPNNDGMQSLLLESGLRQSVLLHTFFDSPDTFAPFARTRGEG